MAHNFKYFNVANVFIYVIFENGEKVIITLWVFCAFPRRVLNYKKWCI